MCCRSEDPTDLDDAEFLEIGTQMSQAWPFTRIAHSKTARENVRTLYDFRGRKTQREIDQRVRDERDRVQKRDVEPSLVDDNPLRFGAAPHEVVGLCVYD